MRLAASFVLPISLALALPGAAVATLAESLFADSTSATEWDVELREAWVSHRLLGRLDEACDLYTRVTGSEEAPADLRARAAIGLALLERDRGDDEGTRRWLERAREVPGANPRWGRNARRLLAEMEDAERPNPVSRPEDLAHEVERLQEKLLEQTHRVEARDRELRLKIELIGHLRERLEARTSAERRGEEIQRSEASRFLEELAREDKELRDFTRNAIRSSLLNAKKNLREGRYFQAYNELLRILNARPNHREALQLAARCRRLMAESAGRGTLGPSPTARREEERGRVRRMVVGVMQAYFEKGRKLYRDGNTVAAIEAFQRVLEEYAWSPVPLLDGDVETIVQPADRALKRCLAETGAGPDALSLLEEESRLQGLLRKSNENLLDQEEALAKADSSIEQLHAAETQSLVREDVARKSRLGLAAMKRGENQEALETFRDVITLLDWFPPVDPDEGIRRKIDDYIATLTKKQAPPEIPSGEKGARKEL